MESFLGFMTDQGSWLPRRVAVVCRKFFTRAPLGEAKLKDARVLLQTRVQALGFWGFGFGAYSVNWEPDEVKGDLWSIMSSQAVCTGSCISLPDLAMNLSPQPGRWGLGLRVEG